jgi:hypothetical protein
MGMIMIPCAKDPKHLGSVTVCGDHYDPLL